MSARRLAIAPEVTAFNFPFLWLLSFFYKVEVLFPAAGCARFLGGRLAAIDLSRYVNADQAQIKRDEAYERWSRLAPAIDAKDWTRSWRGRPLDMSLRVKQSWGISFERMVMLSAILDQMVPSAVFVDNRIFRTLRSIDPRLTDFWKHPSHPLSFVNRALDVADAWLLSVLKAGKLGLQLIKALLQRGPSLPKDISILWDAVLYYELSLSKEKCVFNWFVDGVKVGPSDVLFLSPFPVAATFRKEAESQGYHIYSLAESYSHVGFLSLLRVFFIWAALFFRAVVTPFGFERILTSQFLIEALRYEPLLDHLQPKLYVESLTSIGHENAHVAAINARGIHTVLYCYSANSYLWTSEKDRPRLFRSTLFSHVMAKELLGWHPSYSQFIESHLQPWCAPRALGPVMSGDESIMLRPAADLRSQYQLPSLSRSRYLSVFDVSPVLKGHSIPDLYPVYYTEEYVMAFLEHVMRLVSERKELVVVYKPKRNLGDPRFGYSKKFHAMLEELKSNGRGVVLPEDVNPWLPIRLADICVSMPFTSTVLGAAHHGVFGLFHDPLGSARQHRYSEVDAFITHGYDSFRSKVIAQLENPVTPSPVTWKNFIGTKPGAVSALEFTEYISSFIKRRP